MHIVDQKTKTKPGRQLRRQRRAPATSALKACTSRARLSLDKQKCSFVGSHDLFGGREKGLIFGLRVRVLVRGGGGGKNAIITYGFGQKMPIFSIYV